MLCCWSSLFWYTDYKSTRTFRTAKGLVLGQGDQKANPRPGHAVGLLPSTFQFPPHIQPRQTHSPANTFIFLSNDRNHDINHERPLKGQTGFYTHRARLNCAAIFVKFQTEWTTNTVHTFRKYQKKSAFSMPIYATPAAEPMMRMDPPVPAQ